PKKRYLCHESSSSRLPHLTCRNQSPPLSRGPKMRSLMRCHACPRQLGGHYVDRAALVPIWCIGVPTLRSLARGSQERVMTLTKTEVLASLERVAGPDGLALPKTGTLSDIVVSDGKVFFSISVDAAAVNAWEPVRRRAEATIRALPGVTSVMVALTAERT